MINSIMIYMKPFSLIVYGVISSMWLYIYYHLEENIHLSSQETPDMKQDVRILKETLFSLARKSNAFSGAAAFFALLK